MPPTNMSAASTRGVAADGAEAANKRWLAERRSGESPEAGSRQRLLGPGRPRCLPLARPYRRVHRLVHRQAWQLVGWAKDK
jgi:hypothetical protein